VLQGITDKIYSPVLDLLTQVLLFNLILKHCT